jgi:hypothetical protein
MIRLKFESTTSRIQARKATLEAICLTLIRECHESSRMWPSSGEFLLILTIKSVRTVSFPRAVFSYMFFLNTPIADLHGAESSSIIG